MYYWCISEVNGMDFVKWARKRAVRYVGFDSTIIGAEGIKAMMKNWPEQVEKISHDLVYIDLLVRPKRYASHAPRVRR